MSDRADDWLRQAENDLLWAEDTLRAGRYAQACFAAQQAAEKALKAVALRKGADQVRSHSILEIARALQVDGEVENAAKRLDLYYISARYPDAFPAGAPFEFFTEDQAREAIGLARLIVEGRAAGTGAIEASRDVLVGPRRDPLFGFSTSRLLEWLRSALARRVREAYLFGSFGTREFGPHSDIDVMLVVDTDLPFVERAAVFDDLRARVPSLEILVYTPEEFERLTTEPTAGFWRSVVPAMRRIA